MEPGLIALLIVIGAVFALGGLAWAFSNADYWPAGFIAFVVGVVMVMVGIGGAAYESDKNHCLKDLPTITQRETKWLDGECYMKAKDGKFVPLEWIEEGYER